MPVQEGRPSAYSASGGGRPARLLCLLMFVAFLPAARAAEIAPGVTYTLYNAPGPNRVHVVAVDRLRSEYKLMVGWPQMKRNFTSRMPTSAIAAQYDNPPDRQVLAATNGSFFGAGNDIVGWPVASDGEMLQRPNTQNDTFYFDSSRTARVESNIQHVNGTITFANGTSIPLQRYNQPADSLNATAFTPQWDSSTRSSGGYVEVILSDVTYPMRSDKEVSGIVSAVRTGSASADNAIPPGGMVIFGGLDARNPILANTAVGDRWRMRFRTSSQGMNNADFAITGIGWIVHDGAPHTSNWAVRPSGFPGARHPRTVLAASDTHVFLVVCDGRSGASVGMTFQEMSDFLTGTLGVTEAINLDGGGSSTMVVDGAVMNTPSDGAERAVADAVMLVKEPAATEFPLADSFGPGGRLPGWDDKFEYAAVTPFEPISPNGDGYVLKVVPGLTEVNTVRHGHFNDTDYSVEADIFCEYRPGDAPDGFERAALFARDSGTGALGLSTHGGGNCYAMLYDSHTGAVRAGKYVAGQFTDFIIPGTVSVTASGWRRFRIDCYGSRIEYRLDGDPIAQVMDDSFARGFFGVGCHEFFDSAANVHGTRADNFLAFIDSSFFPVRGDFDGDGDVDMDDFGHFQACITGSSVPQLDLNCANTRLDGDSDVDDADLLLFRACFTGPNGTPPDGCQEL